jgi:thiosulfate reductase cytochrome b subunit
VPEIDRRLGKATAAMLTVNEPEKAETGHSRSVRLLHWILAASVLTLALSGFLILTGLTMSPGVAAAFPGLLDLFGGSQSARTIHFCVFATLFAFIVVHVRTTTLPRESTWWMHYIRRRSSHMA